MIRYKFGTSWPVLTRIIIAVILIVIIFPLLWIVSLSFRDEHHIYEAYAYIIPKYFTVQNFRNAFDYASSKIKITFPRMYLNSMIVSFSAISIAIVLAVIGGFGFANFRFVGKHPIFNIIILSMMLPIQVTIIPLFLLFSKLKLINNLLSLILVYAALGIPLSLLILKTFFEQIPGEMQDAAKIDGSSDLQYLLRIVVPLSRPAIASCIIFLFLQTWNEFLLAMIFIQKGPSQTLPAVIGRIGGAKYVIPWGVYSASIVISALPVIVIFIIFQRWFIEGITLGALKG